MYGITSLQFQYFSPRSGSNVHEKVFYFIFLDQKSSIKNKNFIHVTHTTD